jgi:hypothetical protein
MVEVIDKDSSNLAVDDIQKQLPSTLDGLNEVSKTLAGIAVPSTFSSSHGKLDEAVKQNKLIYQQMGAILKNPIDPDTQKTMDELSSNIEECTNTYLSVSIKDNEFILPNDLQNLVSKIKPYVMQKQDEYSRINTLMASFTEYFDSMSKLIVTFETSRVDMNQALTTARGDRTSWDQLFALIDNSEKIVQGVKNGYDNMKVPSQLKSFNNTFTPVLDDTLAYYIKLRLAAMEDKNFVKEGMIPEEAALKETEINELYQDSEKTNTSSVQNYQKFTSDFSVTKNKFLNPDYVMTLNKGK